MLLTMLKISNHVRYVAFGELINYVLTRLTFGLALGVNLANCKTYFPKKEARYVLEINAGVAKSLLK